MSRKDDLLGNGSLTVASRVMSVIGVPVAGLLIVFLGTEIWGELKDIREEKVQIRSILSRVDQKLTEGDRRDDGQDIQIDRLWDRVRSTAVRP